MRRIPSIRVRVRRSYSADSTAAIDGAVQPGRDRQVHGGRVGGVERDELRGDLLGGLARVYRPGEALPQRQPGPPLRGVDVRAHRTKVALPA
ncbi:hypothetical protein GCM10020218_055000 [Dactylosporangium vinaceum]